MSKAELFAALNALLVLAALVCACLAPQRVRPALFSAALVIAADWLLYCLAWAEFTPKMALAVLGVAVDGDTQGRIIMFTDALSAVLVLAASGVAAWGIAIASLYAIQIITNDLFWTYKLLPWAQVDLTLNATFWGILAVIIFVGGPGVKDAIRNRLGGVRSVRGVFAPLHTEVKRNG